MAKYKTPPFKAITFRLRHPADAELQAMATRFHTNKTDMLHRLIRRAYKTLEQESAENA